MPQSNEKKREKYCKFKHQILSAEGKEYENEHLINQHKLGLHSDAYFLRANPTFDPTRCPLCSEELLRAIDQMANSERWQTKIDKLARDFTEANKPVMCHICKCHPCICKPIPSTKQTPL